MCFRSDVVESKCSAEENFKTIDLYFFKLGIPSNYRIHRYYFTNQNVSVVNASRLLVKSILHKYHYFDLHATSHH